MIPILACIALTGLPGADPPFLRGDADGSGHISITDPILVLQYAFQGGMSPIGCLDASDADDSGAIDLSDAVLLLGYLFQGSPWPTGPFPIYGFDETEDGLDCQIVLKTPEECIVFCCERSTAASGSLFHIRELGPKAQFAIVLFDEGLLKFPDSDEPAPATEEMIEAGLAMVRSAGTSHGSCPKPALFQALSYAERAATGFRKIIFSGGLPACQGSDPAFYADETLVEVSARNVGVRIDTFYCGDDPIAENWLRELAARNGGRFTKCVR